MALKYCPECGNKVPENAKFCPDCGYKLEIPEEPTITQEPEVIEPEVIEEPETTQSRPPIDMVDVKDVKPSKIKSWKVVCIGAVVLIAILCVVFIPKRKEEPVSITQASTEDVASTETVKETEPEIDLSLKNDNSIKLESLTINNVKMWVPEGYEVDDSRCFLTYETDDVQFGVVLEEIDSIGIGLDDIRMPLVEYVDNHMSNIPKNNTTINLTYVSDTQVNVYNDCLEIVKRASGTDSNSPLSVCIKVIYRQGYDRIIRVISSYWGEPHDYIAVEDKILNSIEILGNSTSTASSTGVSKEVKEFVDGFEAFFNKYVDVMESIASGNNLSAIADYATLLSEYAEWMEKIDEFESKDMTAEDSKYFWDAYARVMSKLTSAGLSDK